MSLTVIQPHRRHRPQIGVLVPAVAAVITPLHPVIIVRPAVPPQVVARPFIGRLPARVNRQSMRPVIVRAATPAPSVRPLIGRLPLKQIIPARPLQRAVIVAALPIPTSVLNRVSFVGRLPFKTSAVASRSLFVPVIGRPTLFPVRSAPFVGRLPLKTPRRPMQAIIVRPVMQTPVRPVPVIGRMLYRVQRTLLRALIRPVPFVPPVQARPFIGRLPLRHITPTKTVFRPVIGRIYVRPTQARAIIGTMLHPVASGLSVGSYVFYAVDWDVPDVTVINGSVLPVRFALSRVDGQTFTVHNTDTAQLDSTAQDSGAMTSTSNLSVDSFSAASVVDFATLFSYTPGTTGLYTFDLTIHYDGQTLKARKKLVVD